MDGETGGTNAEGAATGSAAPEAAAQSSAEAPAATGRIIPADEAKKLVTRLVSYLDGSGEVYQGACDDANALRSALEGA